MSLTWADLEDLPIDSELANLHLRLDGEDDLQALAHSVYLPAAVEWAEGQTRRALASREHKWSFKRFPYGSRDLILPRGRCTAVESIVYWESSGVQVTLRGPTSSVPGTDYQEDLTNDAGGRLKTNAGMSWPSADQNQINPITITFTAGYDYAPLDVQNAMLMFAADRLEIASEVDLTKEYTNTAAERLLAPFELYDFTADLRYG